VSAAASSSGIPACAATYQLFETALRIPRSLAEGRRQRSDEISSRELTVAESGEADAGGMVEYELYAPKDGGAALALGIFFAFRPR
jgi:hypothetical protein